jgi:hypothetical protein
VEPTRRPAHFGNSNSLISSAEISMTERNADAEVALQYLVWALEHIEKAGDKDAARHARMALDALREAMTDPV